MRPNLNEMALHAARQTAIFIESRGATRTTRYELPGFIVDRRTVIVIERVSPIDPHLRFMWNNE